MRHDHGEHAGRAPRGLSRPGSRGPGSCHAVGHGQARGRGARACGRLHELTDENRGRASWWPRRRGPSGPWPGRLRPGDRPRPPRCARSDLWRAWPRPGRRPPRRVDGTVAPDAPRGMPPTQYWDTEGPRARAVIQRDMRQAHPMSERARSGDGLGRAAAPGPVRRIGPELERHAHDLVWPASSAT